MENITQGYTRDSKGNILTYKASNGYSYSYTRDSEGNELTYKTSNGYSYSYTRDSEGNELTYKTSDYPDVIFKPLVKDSEYTLYLGDNGRYCAGCRYFTKADALKHWSSPDVNNRERASLFLTAIINN